jgi:hypothetical protein
MTDRFLFWLIYPIVVIAVLWVGWTQPLRYRFMSPQEIAAVERGEIPGQPAPTPAPPPPPTPKPKPWINPLETRTTR